MTLPGWKKGKHDTYTAFEILVHVCQDREGAVFTQHSLSDEDAQLASELKSGGEEQIAFALLFEAVRREVYLEILVAESSGESLLEQYRQASEKEKASLQKKLARKTREHMLRTVNRFSFDAAGELLKVLSEDRGG